LNKIFSPYVNARLQNFLYRFRFLGLYIIFGFISLIIEFFSRNYFLHLKYNYYISTLFAVFLGIVFAFWANVQFNFKIPRSRRDRALIYFLFISSISGIIQWILIKLLLFDNLQYESGRLLISGLSFLLGYLLHRKYSFKDFKKVGVAVYANGVEDFHDIFNKIGSYPDFIHVDVIDNSMNPNAKEVKPYRLETMKAYWPGTQVQTHIMSMRPSIWLDQLIPHSDVIYVHAESEDNIEKLFNKIRASGKNTGLAITLDTNPHDIIELLKISDYVLVLTIPNPGFSGQRFDSRGFDLIRKINNLNFRNNFILCIDGGVNENIVNKLQAENIVSGSCVLKSSDPKRKIMRLQTLGRYES
tara:strand:+ start:317 stop:1387 length:1071 start_codon:yes stop_codon:yes gene_type:complete